MRIFRDLRVVLLLLVQGVIVNAQYSPVQLPADARFTLNAQVEESKEDRLRIITTGDVRGVRYRLNHWNSQGWVEGFKGAKLESYPADTWRILCHSYPDPSSKACGIERYGITFMVFSMKSGFREWLTVTNGRLGLTAPSIIEVDGAIIYRDNKMASNAMEELSKGKKALIRIPPDLNVPDERVISFDLYGFNEAVVLCRWAIKQVQ